jgi:quercetin dioxygenase-like cupin family protein
MRIGSGIALGLVCVLLGLPAVAQSRSDSQAQSESPGQSEGPSQTLLASVQLDSVIELPLFIRLYRARVPAAQHTTYQGSNTLLYDLSGASTIQIGGGAARPLAEGAGVFIAAGQETTITAADAAPTDLLLFLLSARPNEGKRLLSRPAVAQELYRTGDPLPGLKAGPYEFSLVRLTFPPGMPADPAHYRSGAAIDYVLAGTGALTADGKTEEGSAGMALFEGFGWVHSLANPGEVPLVLLQATISREGDPAVVRATPK